MKYKYKIVKRYGHEQGLTATFRQFRAPETHCSKLHGYALAFEFTFVGNDLDHRNWLISFGELKALKKWLGDTFDHTTLISINDPEIEYFREGNRKGVLDLIEVEEVGMEKFAELAYNWVEENILNHNPVAHDKDGKRRVWLQCVKVNEHDTNGCIYEPPINEDL